MLQNQNDLLKYSVGENYIGTFEIENYIGTFKMRNFCKIIFPICNIEISFPLKESDKN